MDVVYTLALIVILAVSIVFYKMRAPLLSVIWSILSIGIIFTAWDSPEIPFSPYFQLATLVIAVTLGIYSVALYHGME